MAKTANIMARVEPEIKEQAEKVLNGLGISMSQALSMYLRQIALQRKIPFEMALPEFKTPLVLEDLSEEEFDALMESAAKEIEDGKGVTMEEFKEEMQSFISPTKKHKP